MPYRNVCTRRARAVPRNCGGAARQPAQPGEGAVGVAQPPPPDALAVCCKQAGLAFLGLILCLLIIVQVNICLPLACLCFMGCRLFRCRQPNPVQLQQQAATTLFHAELFTAQLKFPPTLGLIPEPWDVETKRALSEDRQLCVRCKGS